VNHPAVLDGRLYPQSPSSWLPVLLLDPRPGEEILDLAAAPGGKSLHIAARMGNRGRLACVEAIRDRFFRLRGNLERGDMKIAATYLKDGRGVGAAVPGRFDRVLLDAPCSSEALLRPQDADSSRHWSLHKVHEAAHKQRGLIVSALLAPHAPKGKAPKPSDFIPIEPPPQHEVQAREVLLDLKRQLGIE
jgi:16S rRNA (cytosine1407-C5)-methyltransferase